MADLRNRGLRDIIVACCDGLAGFEDAIHSAFPAATVQTCVVHLICNALRPVARKDRDQVAKELRKIYSAPNADAAFEALAECVGVMSLRLTADRSVMAGNSQAAAGQ